MDQITLMGNPVYYKVKSNVSTGFKWVASPSADGLYDVQVVQLPSYASNKVGASSFTLIQLTGLKKGVTEFQLDYTRPFESSANQPAKRLTFPVYVDV